MWPSFQGGRSTDEFLETSRRLGKMRFAILRGAEMTENKKPISVNEKWLNRAGELVLVCTPMARGYIVTTLEPHGPRLAYEVDDYGKALDGNTELDLVTPYRETVTTDVKPEKTDCEVCGGSGYVAHGPTGVGDCPKCTGEGAADNVNHPEHYKSEGGIECIDAIQAALTPEEFRGFLKGNVLKYTWRERKKGGRESMQKAEWYLKRFLGLGQ